MKQRSQLSKHTLSLILVTRLIFLHFYDIERSTNITGKISHTLATVSRYTKLNESFQSQVGKLSLLSRRVVRHPTRAICPIFETTAQSFGALDRPFAKIEQPSPIVDNAREIRSYRRTRRARIISSFTIDRSNNERPQIGPSFTGWQLSVRQGSFRSAGRLTSDTR